MNTSPETFTNALCTERRLATRLRATRNTVFSVVLRARRRRVARMLLDSAPQQGALLREHRERTWNRVAGIVAELY